MLVLLSTSSCTSGGGHETTESLGALTPSDGGFTFTEHDQPSESTESSRARQQGAVVLLDDGSEVLDGELILTLTAGAADGVLADYDLELIRTMRDGSLLVRTNTSEPTSSARNRLSDDDRVESAQPNYFYRLHAVPNDPFVDIQAHLTDIGAFEDLGGLTGAGVTVAVLDTGVHPGGFDGFDSLLPGYDFVDFDNEPFDAYDWHGTVIAGLIAQRTDNGVAFAGTAPGVSILPVRIAEGGVAGGGASSDAATEALHYAVDEGADIINFSLGGYGGLDQKLVDALDRAENTGVLVVASVANDSNSFSVWPAAHPSVLAVGSSDLQGALTDYSNFGPEVDILAPGGNAGDLNEDGIEDAVFQEHYWGNRWWYDYPAVGTSFATPQVVAAAALLIEAGLSEPQDLRDALIHGSRTATDPNGYASWTVVGDPSPVFGPVQPEEGPPIKTWPLLDIPLALAKADEIIQLGAPMAGDFNLDGVVDSLDIDLFSYLQISCTETEEQLARLDLDGDGVLGWGDRVIWVEDVVGTRMGDADLDGDIDIRDFVTLVIKFWPYSNSCDQMATPQLCRTWDSADFDGNARVDITDFNYLSMNYGFSR